MDSILLARDGIYVAALTALSLMDKSGSATVLYPGYGKRRRDLSVRPRRRPRSGEAAPQCLPGQMLRDTCKVVAPAIDHDDSGCKGRGSFPSA